MPAKFTDAARTALLPSLSQRRRSERRICSDVARVRMAGGEYAARLVDISTGGIGLTIEAFLPLRPGTDVVVIHPQLGEVACQLRWSMHPRYGADFRAGSHALSRVMAFYDSLPRNPGELM